MPRTGRRTSGEKGGLDVLGAAGEIGHQERGMDRIALVVAKVDAAEPVAGLAGGVDVLHAIALVDLRREQLGHGPDLPVEELPEEGRVIDDPLVLLL